MFPPFDFSHQYVMAASFDISSCIQFLVSGCRVHVPDVLSSTVPDRFPAPVPGGHVLDVSSCITVSGIPFAAFTSPTFYSLLSLTDFLHQYLVATSLTFLLGSQFLVSQLL